MTAAGWYHADNDPPGTHRYWDGGAWVGQALPVNQPEQPNQQPAALDTAGGYELIAPVDDAYDAYGVFDVVHKSSTPEPVAQPGQQSVAVEFAPGLKVLAIFIAGLKALPLILGALLLRWLVNLGRELDRAVGTENAERIRDADNRWYLLLAILALPLIIQLIAAFAKRPLILFCVSLVLTLIDVLAILGYASGGSLFMLLMSMLLFVGQASMTIWAYMIRQAQRQTKRSAAPAG